MNPATISGVIGVIAYALILRQLYKKSIEQNLASRLLWALLDGMVAVAIIYKGGTNWKMPAAYSLGCIAIAVVIIRHSTWTWKGIHTFIAAMVLTGAYSWLISGPVVATVILSCTVFIAGIPQIIDAYNTPFKNPVLPTVLQLMGAAVSASAGEWNIIDKMFALACLSYFVCLLGATLIPRFTERNVEAKS